MKREHLFSFLVAAVGLNLSACMPMPGDSARPYRVPVPAPAAPMAPYVPSNRGDLPAQPLYAQQQNDDYNVPGVREVHAVTDIAQCQQMSQHFKQLGLRLRLTRAKPTGDPTLKYLCIFEGPDAVENRFADPRSNPPQEYQ
ncbi:hypothetical protein H6F67_17135 [Microcoleus sp. FACHB-1515]|uniref:hypothetical protein n=1 Tax=Cyanophyceae TaxID=3028117 RepID=UPI001681D76D|nr:hypothetical protein [Microcoleus sp. FACHB-1515]MBD2091570.1 hypothetical protein [Microcoleus sp. FACHB-1515]